ncbi:MAG: PIN domain-containing protein [Hormoscilla sp. GUM202]|nr:PIN domain-containing protein [Hormoscilla sp. GUM202]MBO1351550.1 PIN domain-containing protein [Hormoscilla sp. GUM202]
MSNQVIDINNYKFTSADAVLFDANVWLYIYGRQEDVSPRNRATYTLALRRIRSARGQIFLDGFVLSEFINAYARFVYNKLPAESRPAEFKIFRNSAGFKPIARKIARQVRKILQKCQLTETGLETVDWEPILTEYAIGGADFNDMMLAELCKKKV